MRNNIVTAIAGDKLYIKTDSVFQYDYGLKLVISGVELPQEYDVHFSNTHKPSAKTSTGDSTGVVIPDEYLLSGEDVHAWIYLHTGDRDTDGESIYHIHIPVIARAAIAEEQITPVEHNVIREALEKIEEAVEQTEANVEKYPYVSETGYWMVYDAELGEFVNTGEKAVGFSPVATVVKEGAVATITVTDENGTTTAEVYDGAALIDDTAGAGDTDKSWSADKITTELDLKAPKESPEFTGSISLGRKENTTIGVGSFAVGFVVEASGAQSHAEGGGTTASGSQSHAEGAGTTASNYQAHAEGAATTASGSASHAEGAATRATNSNAHAEGASTTASGSNSHAEGAVTTASGSQSHTEGYLSAASAPNAHAEGYKTIANSANSHAEGSETQAINEHAHAEGNTTMASGTSSHAEGNLSVASRENAHAEGYHTSASGNNSHAEGDTTTASGQHSHAEGTNTQATANGAHAEGSGTKASGAYSHAEGSGYNTGVGYKYNTYNTSTNAVVSNTNNAVPGASGANSHTEGYRTFASGQSGHAEGYQTYAAENSSHAEGYQTYANNSSAHAEGNFTTASGQYSHAEGSYTLASSTSAHAEGSSTVADHPGAHAEGQNTRALDDGAHAEGQNTKASNDAAHAEGSSTVASNQYAHAEGNTTTASGTAAHSEGYNTTASGTYSHAEGTGSRATGSNAHAEGNTTTASGINSHAEGANTTASADNAHAEGAGTTASSQGSHAEGASTTASGYYSHAEGAGTTAIGYYSHAEGMSTVAKNMAQHAGGRFNLEDPSNNDASSMGYYAEIIGNGSANARSNARTLDWDGNERLMGDLYVGCNSDSTGGTKVAKVTDIPDVSGKIDSSEKGVANGIATLDNSGKVPSAQLPSYVDDVIEVASYSALPGTGESGKIYVTLDTNKAYRWSGSAYIEINPSQVVDVQVNGTTVVSSGIANVPVGGSSLGVFKTDSSYGIEANNEGRLNVSKASSPNIKAGTNQYKPITPVSQHEATFYGLAKAAGQDMAASANAVGTYTDEAKTAIRSMIGAGTYSKPVNGIPASDLAEGVVPDISTKADKNNTVLTGSLSLGRKENTNVGDNSFAVGTLVEASGNMAHAEGSGSVASGLTSHAEGSTTHATGALSHAEGLSTTASGTGSHSEGLMTTAADTGAHAEGTSTQALGICSHAEGNYTVAEGTNSHAEGWYTKAVADNSHVSGRYNIVDNYDDLPEWAANTSYAVGDKVKVTTTENNETVVKGYICKTANNDASFTASKWDVNYNYNYVEIIGNGTADNERSNARTLDWDGNEYLAGSLELGGSLSANRKDNTTIGENSVAFGYDVEASGWCAHAEGDVTVAAGDCSHAEGEYTTTEGYTAHAEGDSTLAKGYAAHAEGYGTVAVGNYSRASGTFNVIEFDFDSIPLWDATASYAIGDRVRAYNTQNTTYYVAKVANSNVRCTNKNTWQEYWYGDYAEIVGNGTDENERSNAYALTWTGDGHYAGNLYVGCNSDSTGGTRLPHDVQVNGTSVVSNGVANIPLAIDTLGVIKITSVSGITVNSTTGVAQITQAPDGDVKAGTNGYKPIVPSNQHKSIYYGLSKLAGVDLASQTVTVGTYPETSKTAIRNMLGVETGTTLVETVSGTTPAITAQPNVRYNCGEVSTIDITPPSSGTCDIFFTSGSTAAVLTVPNTVKFPAWFDATALETNTIYEIMITDATYGSVMTWAS